MNGRSRGDRVTAENAEDAERGGLFDGIDKIIRMRERGWLSQRRQGGEEGGGI